MAYHFAAKVISMGKGGSAVHRAAYQARTQLESERLDVTTRNYAYKNDLQWEGMFAGKDAGDWTRNRGKVWNRAEAAERQANGQPARDFEMSIPNMLTRKQQIQIITDFGREKFARKGLIADVKLHSDYDERGQVRRGVKPGDARNDHVHLMTTTRIVEGDGFAKTKTALRDMNSKEQLAEWREAWAKGCAKALRRAGHEQEADRWEVGHLTLPAQREAALARGDNEWADQLDREPDIKMGLAAWQMEERGIQTERGDERRDIQGRNAEREDLKSEAKVIDLALARQEREDRAERQAEEAARREQAAQRRAETGERGRFEAWGNGLRAEMQSARHEAETALGRTHQAETLNLEAGIDRDRAKLAAQHGPDLDAIRQRQQRKGLAGFLYRVTGRAVEDQAQAAAIGRTQADLTRRAGERRQILAARQAGERAALSRSQDREAGQVERRITHARERREREGWTARQDRQAKTRTVQREVTTGQEIGRKEREIDAEAENLPVEGLQASEGHSDTPEPSEATQPPPTGQDEAARQRTADEQAEAARQALERLLARTDAEIAARNAEHEGRDGNSADPGRSRGYSR